MKDKVGIDGSAKKYTNNIVYHIHYTSLYTCRLFLVSYTCWCWPIYPVSFLDAILLYSCGYTVIVVASVLWELACKYGINVHMNREGTQSRMADWMLVMVNEQGTCKQSAMSSQLSSIWWAVSYMHAHMVCMHGVIYNYFSNNFFWVVMLYKPVAEITEQ